MAATKVSGLALTAIINIALEILCFVLYSIFRKQSSNANIYLAARIQREKGSRHGSRHFAIENYLPSSDWLKEAWRLSDDEIIKTAGLDSFVFIRIYIFCFRFFGACTIVGLFVLVPVNYLNGQIFNIDTITSATLDSFTVSNVTNGSERRDDVTEEVSTSQGKRTHEVGKSSRPPQLDDDIFRTQLVAAVTMFSQVMQIPRFLAFLQPPLPSQQVGSLYHIQKPDRVPTQVIHTANSMETPVHLLETM
ncbi:hypothetical protein L7F22_030419 [Adiantum nelumboides]|nr:hypothetical protein [Adiantum nelumboides]